MKENMLEQQIRTAVEHASPDQLNRIVTSCNAPDSDRKDIIYISEKKNKLKRRHSLVAIATIAAVFVLCFGGYFMFLKTADSPVADSVIMLDVNPSLSLYVDNEETVLSVEALNDDAKEVLGDIDLKNTSLEVAVNAIIGSMLQKGYLGDVQNTILVSVENKDAAYGEALQEKVSKIINTAMQTDSMDAMILSQSINADDTALAELANKYNISMGKASLIQEVIAQVPTLTFEDLAPMTINDIALISISKDVSSENVTQNGTASANTYIGQEEALRLVCSDAGVDLADVTEMSVEFDSNHGIMVYEVEFETATNKWEYEINASTGEIINSKQKDNNSSVEVSGYIGADSAMEIALAHAGIASEDVLEREIELDSEDHVMIYKVEFETSVANIQYRIEASTGEVLNFEIKTKKDGKVEGESGEKVNETTSANTAYIDDEAAKAAALADAGVNKSSTVYLKCYYEYHDGHPQYYIVEFAAGDTSYVYTLDLYSGEVLWSHTYPYHSHP